VTDKEENDYSSRPQPDLETKTVGGPETSRLQTPSDRALGVV